MLSIIVVVVLFVLLLGSAALVGAAKYTKDGEKIVKVKNYEGFEAGFLGFSMLIYFAYFINMSDQLVQFMASWYAPRTFDGEPWFLEAVAMFDMVVVGMVFLWGLTALISWGQMRARKKLAKPQGEKMGSTKTLKELEAELDKFLEPQFEFEDELKFRLAEPMSEDDKVKETDERA